MAQAQGLTLAHIVDVAEVGGLTYACQTHRVALGLKSAFKLPMAVEMVLEGSFVASGHHEDISQPGTSGLLDDVLDGRLVDYRQHLLGRGLGCRQEAGP